jgi:hypothetical protein
MTGYWSDSHEMKSLNQLTSDEIIQSHPATERRDVRINRSISAHQMQLRNQFNQFAPKKPLNSFTQFRVNQMTPLNEFNQLNHFIQFTSDTITQSIQAVYIRCNSSIKTIGSRQVESLNQFTLFEAVQSANISG